MNTLGDALLAFIVAIVIVAVIIGTGVFISLTRERRRMARQAPTEFGLLHDDTWDLMVDGQAIATLTPTGQPEDLNTRRLIWSVTYTDIFSGWTSLRVV